MDKDGALFVNIGSPVSPTTRAVSTYLKRFLMDPYVIDLPWVCRFILVRGLIVPFRSGRSTEAYRSIWNESQSPLLFYSEQFLTHIRPRLKMPTELGMMYSAPEIPGALARLASQGVNRIWLLPLYPHYAMSSFEATEKKVGPIIKKEFPEIKIRVWKPFYAEPGFIQTMATAIEPYLKQPWDHILFSYHGVPERHLQKTRAGNAHCLIAKDCCQGSHSCLAFCYRHQTRETTEALSQRLDLRKHQYTHSYQSRLSGRWLRPFTDEILPELAAKGKRRVIVVCPAFVADCLETLEEIGIRAQRAFEKAGGEKLTLVPAMNSRKNWIEFIARRIEYLQRDSTMSRDLDAP